MWLSGLSVSPQIKRWFDSQSGHIPGLWIRYPAEGMLWVTVPSMENVAQPPLGKPVGSEVGGQDPRPWISSPVGNQALSLIHI